MTEKVYDYAIDVIFCVDLTSDMHWLLEQFQENCLAMLETISATVETVKGPVKKLRAKIIGFRDFVDAQNALMETKFYELPAERSDLLRMLQSLEPKGGGDRPENSLEAVALALKADWTQEGSFRRHVICVLTNAPPVELGERKNYPDYPSGMPENLEELSSWYQQGTGKLDLRGKRMILFAPDDGIWEAISQQWDRCLHIQLGHNEPIEHHIDQIGAFVCANV